MKISEAIDFCLQYQKANSKINTVRCYEFLLGKFNITLHSLTGIWNLKKLRRLSRFFPISLMERSKTQSDADIWLYQRFLI